MPASPLLPPSPARILALAAGTSLTVALLDQLVGHARSGRFGLAPPFLAVTTAAVFAGYLAAWWGLAAPLARRLRLDAHAAAYALGAAVLGLQAGITAVQLGEPPPPPSTSASGALAGLLGGAVAYAALRGRAATLPFGTALAGPVLAAVALALGAFFGSDAAASPTARATAVALGAVLAWGAVAWPCRRGDRRTRGFALAVLWLLAVASPLAAPAERRAAHVPAPAGGRPRAVPHALLIVADTLRGDMLSCLAESAPPTPHLDALARSAAVFTKARAPAPWTLPSMCSLLTGEPPLVHRAMRADSVLPYAVPTLAERMAAAGYRTAAFGENHFLLPRSNLDRGFEEYHFFPKVVSLPPLGSLLLRAVAPGAIAGKMPAARLNELALPWIEEHADESFFVWLHYYDVHLPYAPPPGLLRGLEPPAGMGASWSDLLAVRQGHLSPDEAERAWIEELYRAEVRYLDAQLGVLFERLRALGLWDDTLIVFTSDHGEEFWEHGGYEHGHSVHDEVIEVPLIVKLPGRSTGVRIDTPVSLEAVAATILQACGVEPPPTSWAPAAPLLGPDGTAAAAPAAPLLCIGNVYYEPRVALVHGGFKYVRFPQTGREQLFDLARDPGETQSIDATAGAKLDEMRNRFRLVEAAALLRHRQLDVQEGERAELGSELMEELRSIGYVK